MNAAGVFFPKPFLEHLDADYDQYMQLNKASFFITQKIAANFVAKGNPGAIVNIGSMWGKQAIAATPSSAYSMAKAGLHSLTQHLAMELASKHSWLRFPPGEYPQLHASTKGCTVYFRDGDLIGISNEEVQ